jgi:hypothetical protein
MAASTLGECGGDLAGVLQPSWVDEEHAIGRETTEAAWNQSGEDLELDVGYRGCGAGCQNQTVLQGAKLSCGENRRIDALRVQWCAD